MGVPIVPIIVAAVVLAFIIFAEIQIKNVEEKQDIAYKEFKQRELDSDAKYDNIARLCDELVRTVNDKNDQVIRLMNESNYMKAHIVELINQSNLHEYKLNRLSNGTSNADVLDELSRVRIEVHESMLNTYNNLNDELSFVKRNVSKQLQSAQSAMDITVTNVDYVVANASSNLQSMQAAVKTQLANISVSLNNTLVTVNEIVSTASKKIHQQVSDVQDSINEYVAFSNKQFAAENDFVKYQLAGTFTLLACLISLYHITQHQRHYARPDVQRRIMAIIWMVPIYSMTSWLTLVCGSTSERLFGSFRDIYEAYAVYTFFGFLFAVLEEGRGLPYLIERITIHVEEEQQAIIHAQRSGLVLPVEHIKPPFPCCYQYESSVRIAITWLFQCKLLVMQFVLIKPLSTILPFLLVVCGVDYYNIPIRIYPEGDTSWYHEINWQSPHLYILMIENISVSLAFYGLLCFFHGIEEELTWCDPWPKFLCIKGVVFMTFWQGLIISMMSSVGMVDEKAASQIQHLLICIEMLVASLAHIYVFPHKEWQEGFKREKQIQLKDTLAFRDFMKDVKQMVTRWSAGGVTSPGNPPKAMHRKQTSGTRSEVTEASSLLRPSAHRASYQSDENYQIVETPPPNAGIPVSPLANLGYLNNVDGAMMDQLEMNMKDVSSRNTPNATPNNASSNRNPGNRLSSQRNAGYVSLNQNNQPTYRNARNSTMYQSNIEDNDNTTSV